LLESYESTIEKHGNTIKVDTLVEQATCTLFTLRETLETERESTAIDTLLWTPKNDTSPKIADSTITAEPTQIVQIPITKTLEIVLLKVNTNDQNNKPFRVFTHFNHKI